MNSNVHLDEYLDFQKYWQVLQRRWVPAVGTFAGVVGLAIVGSLLAPSIYEAEAELLIRSDKTSKLTGLEDDLGKIEGLTIDSNPVTTQARIIRSRPIVTKVIKELELKDNDGEFLKYQDVVADLKVKPVVGTDVLHIAYTNQDPELAASMVNKLVDSYIEADSINNRSSGASAKEFIEQQLPQVESKLKDAEAKLRQFKNQNSIASLGEETSANIASLSGIDDRLDEIKASLESVNARFNRLNVQLNMSWQEATAVSALSQSAGVQRALEQLQEVKVRLAQKRNVLSDNAPQVVSLQEEEADLKRLLNEQISLTLGSEQSNVLDNVNILALGELKQAQIAEFANLGLQKEGLEKEISALTKTRNSYQAKADSLPELQEQQRELERQVEAAQSTYQNLLRRSQDTELIEQQNIGNVRRVSEAVVPEDPIAPRKKIIVASAGILGGFFGLIVAFIIDLRDRSIKNIQEIQEIYPYSLSGVVPDTTKLLAEEQFLLPNAEMANLPQKAVRNISLPAILESYHNIQINLNLLDEHIENKVILVTSAVAGEGKSSVSANLALAQAQCGKQVLLIDGDLRRPTQHSFWELPNLWGLTNILEQEIEWSDTLNKVMPNLDVISSGSTAKHPMSLLNSSFMKAFLLSASSYYDCILIDAPPLVGLADSKILAKLADSLLFVARPGVTNYSAAESSRNLLKDFNVLGIVANGVDVDYRSYGYQSYLPDRKYLEAASS